MNLIDTHCHLAGGRLFAEADALVERARDAGVTRIVAMGTDLEDGRRVIELAERHPGTVWASVGVHPCDVLEVKEADWLEQLRELARHPRVVSIGETGLDYFHPPPDGVGWEAYKARQAEFFRAQIGLAAELGLNVVVHTRGGSLADAGTMMAEWAGRVRAVFHCWVDGWAQAQPLVAAGHLVSFTGIVTYKTALEAQESARQVPQGSWMLETDAPYLAPVPHRGKLNEPAWTRHTAEAVAALRGMTLEAVAAETTATAEGFFRFSR